MWSNPAAKAPVLKLMVIYQWAILMAASRIHKYGGTKRKWPPTSRRHLGSGLAD